MTQYYGRPVILPEMEKEKRKRQQPFHFPKWRSSDAMSASLVAAAHTSQLIPMDSQVPGRRLERLDATEQRAQIDRMILHLPHIIKALQKQRGALERIRAAATRATTLHRR